MNSFKGLQTQTVRALSALALQAVGASRDHCSFSWLNVWGYLLHDQNLPLLPLIPRALQHTGSVKGGLHSARPAYTYDCSVRFENCSNMRLTSDLNSYKHQLRSFDWNNYKWTISSRGYHTASSKSTYHVQETVWQLRLIITIQADHMHT